MKFSSLPEHPETIVESVEEAVSLKNSALQYPQLLMGMIAIFLYVGVEVSTASNLPAYMETKLGFAIGDIAPYNLSSIIILSRRDCILVVISR